MPANFQQLRLANGHKQHDTEKGSNVKSDTQIVPTLYLLDRNKT